MHLRVFGSYSDKHISQHLLYFFVYKIPLYIVIFLELLDELLVFDLLEFRDLTVVHYCELSLVGGEVSSVEGVLVVG